ncbi:hypothetical protein B0H14DRAFT_3427354 [Mycena olivaceomarginata]|nr:hypothetical protein B0H14DRAFT_3427354 [Mycena olivaceomarginata]
MSTGFESPRVHVLFMWIVLRIPSRVGGVGGERVANTNIHSPNTLPHHLGIAPLVYGNTRLNGTFFSSNYFKTSPGFDSPRAYVRL